MTNVLIDGEVVTLDDQGHPNFQRLQQRARLRRPIDIRRAAVESPATLYAFDLPALEGYDLRTLPLVERKALLARVVPPAGPLRYLDHIETQGAAFFAQVERMGLEGIIAKKADSLYKGGRDAGVAQDQARRAATTSWWWGSPRPREAVPVSGRCTWRSTWARTWCTRGAPAAASTTSSSVTCGRSWREWPGRRRHACRRVIRAPEPGRRDAREEGECQGLPDDDHRFRATTWVEPRLVAEVRFTEWTNEGLLRHPVFLRFRDDKKPEDCIGEEGECGRGRQRAGAPSAARREPRQRRRAVAQGSAVLQPQEDLLAEGEIHQGRSDRLLPR